MSTLSTRSGASAGAKPKTAASTSKAREQESTADALNTMSAAIQCLKDEMLQRFDETSRQISQMREELKGSIELVSNWTAALEGTTESLQMAVSAHSDNFVRLEDQVLQLRKDVKTLTVCSPLLS